MTTIVRVNLRITTVVCAVLAMLSLAPGGQRDAGVAPMVAAQQAGQAIPGTQAGAPALPAGVPDAWWDHVRTQIERDAYAVRSVADGHAHRLEADNPSQRWHARFSAGGMAIAPVVVRADDGPGAMRERQANSTGPGTPPAWTFGLRLSAYGAGASLTRVQAVAPRAAGDRVEFHYDDRNGAPALTEWYVNAARGLEHGFTLGVPPAGEGPVTLELEVGGGLVPVLHPDGRAIALRGADGAERVRYADLYVTDATGRALSAALGVQAGEPARIRLVVDTSGAIYPLTIDPLLTTPATVLTGEGTSHQFALSVATAGDVNADGFADLVVGARGYANFYGRAYVYAGGPGGISTTPATILEGTGGEEFFGTSVSTAGDVNGDGFADVVVGALAFNSQTGRAYLFLGSATGLVATPATTLTGETTLSQFGASVAPAGDVNGDGYGDVVVDAPAYASYRGRLYVYLGGASGLAGSAATTLTGDAANAYFGLAAATAGDVNGDGYGDLVVGASYQYVSSNPGRAYVYLGGANGLDSTPATTLVGEANGDKFGFAVATAGDVNGDGYADVVVGAYTAGSYSGRVYAYMGGAAGLATTAGATLSSADGEYFGFAVAPAGDFNGDGYGDVVVGEYQFSAETGRSHLYLGGATGLSTTAAVVVTGESSDTAFGNSVATAGDVNGDGYADIVVGARGYLSSTGRAYVYMGGPRATASTPTHAMVGEESDSLFGYAVASAGDVNGDGYADVVVGAHGHASNTGRAYVYLGEPGGLAATAATTLTGEAGATHFGAAVGSAGDVNGDGYADVVVGAYGYDSNTGRAYVYLGGAGGLGTSAATTLTGEAASTYFGASLASAGDVNGDGYADVVVGAYGYDANTGRTHLYLGGASGLATAPAITLTGEATNDNFGRAVATAGDVNGDGYADVVVGALRHDNNTGRAYVYLGGASGLAAVASTTLNGEASANYFGASVASAGDVNGDGYADVVVGAWGYGGFTGRAYVYQGAAGGLSAAASVTLTGEAVTNYFGSSVAGAGDVNGDGYADVLVGAPAYGGNTGRSYVYQGGVGGLATVAATVMTGEAVSNNFGQSAATVGDVNGDGYADVMIGAYRYQTNTGKAYLYVGNLYVGRSLASRTRRADGTAPVAYGGRSDSTAAFRVVALGHSPFGRTRVKLEWEVKPLGTAFTGTATGGSAAWTDTTTAGAALNELVGGLTGSTPYHWRVRVRYHPASHPYAQVSRWVTQPWAGAQETRLRTKAKLVSVVTWANPAGIGYGTALGITQLNATASVPGTFAYAPSMGAVLNAGSGQTLSVVFTPTDAATYASVSASVTIDVSQATPSISWASPAPLVGGTALGASQLNATATAGGTAVSGTFAYTPAAGTILAVGSHTLSAVFTPSTLNYTSATATVTIEVTAPPISTVYLAEGATSPFFDTRLALLNPGATATTATLTFSRSGTSAVTTSVPVPARTRVTVSPKTLAGMGTAEFSTKVESDQPLIVDRTLSWDAAGYGAHAETAVAAPALTWYLAEGATHSGFSLFYLLQNPNAAAAEVRVRYLRPSGAPLEKTYTLPPTSRNNIWVNEEDFPGLGKALAATDVSAIFESLNSQPIIVERALYLDLPGQMFGAGHESAGVTAPALQWFLAEGNTGPYFDLFVLIANPGTADAQVEATYLRPDGTVIVRTQTVTANSRFNIWVDGEDPLLADTAVSTTIRSTNGVPVIVERALWWPGSYGQWYEAHNSPGATATATRWALAEGEVGGTRGVDTFILLANTSGTVGDVKVSVLFEDGTSAEKTFTVAGNSRFNVDVRSEFPAALDTRFGAIVESLGATPAQIVVERAMYWDAGGQHWAAGTNALATRLP